MSARFAAAPRRCWDFEREGRPTTCCSSREAVGRVVRTRRREVRSGMDALQAQYTVIRFYLQRLLRLLRDLLLKGIGWEFFR